MKEQNYHKIHKNLTELVAKKFQEENSEDIDTNLGTHIKENCEIESAVKTFHEAITLSCNISFKTRGITTKTTTQKSVPWWTEDLTIKKEKIKSPEKTIPEVEKQQRAKGAPQNIYYEEKAN